MPPLTRNIKPQGSLLGTVGNKDNPGHHKNTSQIKALKIPVEDINADPEISSDSESPALSLSSASSGPGFKNGIRNSQRRSIRVPQLGRYGNMQKEKERLGLAEPDRENILSNSSHAQDDASEDGMFSAFGMGMDRKRKKPTTKYGGTTANIHTEATGSKKTKKAGSTEDRGLPLNTYESSTGKPNSGSQTKELKNYATPKSKASSKKVAQKKWIDVPDVLPRDSSPLPEKRSLKLYDVTETNNSSQFTASRSRAKLDSTLDDSESSLSAANSAITPPDSPVYSSQAGDSYDSTSISLAICPLCRETVDPQHLLEFSNGRSRLSVKNQMEFCNQHKERAALDEYRSKGYPTVDWDNLESRLQQHRDHLLLVLDRVRDSHFRSRMDKKVDSGKERNILKSIDTEHGEALTPGYYGRKGAKIFTQWINSTLERNLRLKKASDSSIRADGITSYIQRVLVPELAMQLIMEDMDVDEVQAREILKESIKIGELVHAPVDDEFKMQEKVDEWAEGNIDVERYQFEDDDWGRNEEG
ncbi:hypothetical protein M501DRAFT_987226 [Patellaria atrata CBS 101060]|uniref:Restriction of telomere capping protein 4 n=1 Tax=Patellaria atrata CBS 101060 TaxID=1346257 RepID=A0A9P4S750_9PEZI|nr:hypothetical protein M501DRAFT_987226 [Patellaria atrata CBS 101060]